MRKRRIDGMRSSHWRWRLNEMFVKINGERHYPWRAVDHEGEVLESYVTKTRPKKAAEAGDVRTKIKYGRQMHMRIKMVKLDWAIRRSFMRASMKPSAQYRPYITCEAACALAVAALLSVPHPAGAQTLGVQASCTGTLPNDWTFAAEALDGRFLHIIWSGTQGQTRVSVLNYYSTNAEGFPVFRGTLQDAIKVALVDQSGGAPTTGTDVIVFSEEWGWFPGPCRQLGSAAPEGVTSTAAPEGVMSTEVILQNLVGTRDSSASNWLRRNDFTRVQVVTHSSTGKTERWQQDPSYPVDVVFHGTSVSDVVSAGQ